MPGNVDTRIVQMEFENKDFEQNISKSQRSLERFKKELNFEETSKGLEKFSKTLKTETVDFDHMADNIQKLTDKFTGLGKVGEYVASKVRAAWQGALDDVIRFSKSISTDQLSAGFGKYESLNKAVQVLKSATDESEDTIYGVLDKLNKYTDETSYDFSEGVTSISKLVSSGAADMATAEKTIEGFYNFAAKAGADTAKASHALQYSITQAMSLGYMGASDWKTLENQSMATIDFKTALLDSAVALGKATKEGEKYYIKSKTGKKMEVNATNLWKESLQQQWVTVDVMNDALGKYADTTTEFGAEAYAAAQRCTTFTDALNAWKDMMSTGWMTAYRTIFGDLTEAMTLFSSVCNKVSDSLDGIMSGINSVLSQWNISGGRDSLWAAIFGEMETPDGEILYKGAYGILDILKDIGKMLSDGFWGMIQMFMGGEDYENAMFNDWENNAEYRFWYLGEVLKEKTEEIREAIQNVKNWFEEIPVGQTKSRWQQISDIVSVIFTTIGMIIQVIKSTFHFIGQLFDQDHLGPSVDAIIGLLSNLGVAIKGAGNDAVRGGKITAFFNGLAEAIKPITTFINVVVTGITKLLNRLITGTSHAGSSINVIEKISEFFEGLGKILMTIGTPIIDAITDIFNALSVGGNKAADSNNEKHIGFFEALFGVLQPIAEIIGKVIRFVGQAIALFITWGKESGFFANVWEKIKTVVSSVFDALKRIMEPIGRFFSEISGSIKNLFTNGFTKENLIAVAESIKNAFHNLLGNLKTSLAPVIDKIKNVLSQVWQAIRNFFVTTFTPDNISGAWGKIKTFFAGLFGNIGVLSSPLIEKIKEFFSGIFNSIKDTVLGMTSGKNIFQNIISWFKQGIQSIFSFFSNAVAVFRGKGSFVEKIQNVFGLISESFKKINLTSVLKNMVGPLGIAAAGVLIVKVIKWVKSLFTGVSDATSELSGSKMGGVGKVQSFADQMLKFAISMGIITASLYFLTNMPLFKSIGNGLKSAIELFKGFNLSGLLQSIIGPLGIAVVAFMVIRTISLIANISKAMKSLADAIKNGLSIKLGSGKTEAFGDKMLKIAGAIAILAGVMYLIGTMKWEDIGKGAAAIGFIMLSLYLFTRFLNKYIQKMDWKKSAAFALILYSVGVAIGRIILALKPILELTGDNAWEQWGRAMFTLVVVLGSLALFFRLTKKMTSKTVKARNFIGFILMAGGVYLLIKALMQVINLGFGEEGGYQIEKMLGVLAGVIFMFGAVGFAMKKNSNAFRDVGIYAAGLAALIFMLTKLANMEPGQIATMMVSLAVVLLEFVGFAWLLKKTGGTFKNKNLKDAAYLAAGISLLLFALLPIGKLADDPKGWEKIGMMMTALGGVLGELLLFAWGMKKLNFNKKGFKSIIMLALGVFAMLLVIKPLAKLANKENGWEKLGMMLTGLGAILGMMYLFALGMKKLNFKKKGFGSIVTLAIGIFVILLALKPLAKLANQENGKGWEKLGMMMGTLAFVMATLVASVYFINKSTKRIKVSKMLGGILMIGTLVYALWAVMEVLKPMADMGENGDWSKLAKMGAAFAVALGGLTLSVVAIQKTSQKFTKALGSILMIAAIVGALYATIEILKPLAEMGDDWTPLIKMGAVFAVFIAGIVTTMTMLNKCSTTNTKRIISMGIIIAGIVGTMLLAAVSLMLIPSDMKWSEIIAFFGGIALVSYVILSGMRKIKATDIKKMLPAIAAVGTIALSMVLAGVALLLIPRDMQWYDIIAFMGSFLVVVASIMALTKSLTAIRGFGIAKIVPAIALIGTIGAAMVLAGAALALIPGDMQWYNIATFMLGFTVALVAVMSVAKSLLAISGMNIKKMLPVIALIGTIGLAMVLAGVALLLVPTDMKWSEIAAFMLGFTVAVAAIMGVAKLITAVRGMSIKKMLPVIALIGAVGLAMVLAGVGLRLIPEHIKWEEITAFMGGITAMLLVMAVAIKILQNVPIGSGLKAIGLAVAGIAAVLAAVGALLPYLGDQLGKAIEEASDSLYKASNMIFAFSDNMGKTSEADVDKGISIMGKLKNAMEILFGFGKHSQDFSAFATGVWEISVALGNFHSLTGDIKKPEENGAILLLEYLQDNMNDFSSVSFGDAPYAIAELGASLWIFNDVTKDISFSEGQKLPALQLIEALTGLNGTLSGSVLEFYAFGGAVAKLGSGLESFFDSNSTLPDNVEDDPRFKMLTTLAELGPSLEMLLGLELDQLGVKLAELGGGMSIYAIGAQKMADLEGTEAPDASVAIATLRSVITELNGLAGEFGGSIELPSVPDEDASSTFGLRMAVLAGGLETFISACSGVSGKTQQGLSAIRMLSSINKQLTEETASVITRFPNQVSLFGIASFGLDLRTLAGGLRSFIGASEGINGNTDKGLAAVGLLTELNGKLTEQVINTIKYFPGHDISTLMIGKLGIDLVALASGMAAFCAVEVGDLSEHWGFLEQMKELNTKLTEANIGALNQTISAFLDPVETDRFNDEDYKTFVNDVLHLTSGQQSPMTLFTFGMTQLGDALSLFSKALTDESGGKLYDRAYEPVLTNAKETIDFFVKETQAMPAIPSGLATVFLTYTKDLSELSEPIINLGDALARFSGFIMTAAEADNFDADLITIATEAIATIVNAYATAGKTIDSLYKTLTTSSNGSEEFMDIFGEVCTTLEVGLDNSRVMNYLGAQLGAMMQSLMDPSQVKINGGTVLDSYFSLISTMKSEMDKFNVTEDDIELMITAFGGLSAMVDSFRPDNYSAYGSPMHSFLKDMITDIENSLFDEGSELQLDVEKLTDLFNSLGESIGGIADLALYKSPDDSKIEAFAQDYAKIATAMIQATLGVYKELGALDDNGEILFERASDLEGLASLMEKIASSYRVMTSKESSLTEVGTITVEAIAEGITGSKALIIKAIESLMGGVSGDVLGSIFHDFANQGWSMNFSAMVDSMVDAGLSFDSIYDVINNSVETDDGSFKWTFADVGYYMSAGIAYGVSSGSILIENACREAVKKARIAAMEEADENSPSRVFMEIGSYMSQGMAIGIANKEGLIETSAETATETAIQTVTDAIASIYALMNQEIDTNPTITPVLDMTNLTNGKKTIDEMFGGSPGFGFGRFGIPTIIPPTMAGSSSVSKDYTDSINGVKVEIEAMREEMKTMSESIRNMKMVINSGALVGAIGPDMDQYLGRAGFYAARASISK